MELNFTVLQLLIPFKKSNTIWVDKGSELYNRSMKSRLPDNYIEIHAAQNEQKSVFAEILIRTLKKKSINIRLPYHKMSILIN